MIHYISIPVTVVRHDRLGATEALLPLTLSSRSLSIVNVPCCVHSSSHFLSIRPVYTVGPSGLNLIALF